MLLFHNWKDKLDISGRLYDLGGGGANLPLARNATNYQCKLKRRHRAKAFGGIDLFLFFLSFVP